MEVHDTRLRICIIAQRDISEITSHIDKIVNINYQCNTRFTSLHTAVVYNNVPVASLLLERGADMTVLPLKKTFKDDYECPLLMALKLGESHEEMQLLLLRVLKNTSRDKFHSTALKTIARVTHYAMMYSTERIFFATQHDCQGSGENSAGYHPLMFTLVRVGRLEEDVDKCKHIMEKVLKIVDKDSSMLWQRFRPVKLQRIGAAKHPHTGCTALGILAFEIMRDRKKCLLELKDNIAHKERGDTTFNTFMPPTHPQYNDMMEWLVQSDKKEKEIDANNRKIMAYFSNEFIPCLFAQMIRPMRIALGMSTHIRLGDERNCRIGQLDADVMNITFNELVHGISKSEVGFKHMLC